IEPSSNPRPVIRPPGQHCPPVGVVAEDGLAIIAAVHHVVADILRQQPTGAFRGRRAMAGLWRPSRPPSGKTSRVPGHVRIWFRVGPPTTTGGPDGRVHRKPAGVKVNDILPQKKSAPRCQKCWCAPY